MWKDPFAVTTVLSSLLCSWSHKHSGSACCVTGLSSALSQLASWKKSPGAVPEHSTPPGMQELFWQELPGTDEEARGAPCLPLAELAAAAQQGAGAVAPGDNASSKPEQHRCSEYRCSERLEMFNHCFCITQPSAFLNILLGQRLLTHGFTSPALGKQQLPQHWGAASAPLCLTSCRTDLTMDLTMNLSLFFFFSSYESVIASTCN